MFGVQYHLGYSNTLLPQLWRELPDPGLPILIFTRKNRYYVGYYYKAVVDTTYTGFYADSVKRDVTHWMPLPEPPKGDSI